jgi:hypothetical protein
MSWRKLLLICVGSLFMVVIGLDFLWNWSAHARLEAEIAAIRASGEPIDAKDFQPVPIPDSENAAWYYQKAAGAAAHFNDPYMPDDLWRVSLTEDKLAEVYRNLAMDKPALDWVTQADQYDEAVWPMPRNIGTQDETMPELGPQWELSETLQAFAWMEQRQGQDDLAVRRVGEILKQGDALSHYYPYLVSNLTAGNIEAVAARAAMGLAPKLNIIGTPAATRPTGVSSQQIRDLVAQFLNERQYQASAKRALSGEDRRVLDAGSSFFGHGIKSYLLAPVVTGDTATMLMWNQEIARSFDAPNWAAAKRELPNVAQVTEGSAFSLAIHLFRGIMEVNGDRIVRTYFQRLTDRRAAAIFLAMAHWRADHLDSWPNSLVDLVPDYLHTVPIDPFSPAGHGFSYKADAPAGPIIYSVGEDGIDDGGSEQAAVPIPHRTQELNIWKMKDFVYHLIPPPPTTRPVAQ